MEEVTFTTEEVLTEIDNVIDNLDDEDVSTIIQWNIFKDFIIDLKIKKENASSNNKE